MSGMMNLVGSFDQENDGWRKGPWTPKEDQLLTEYVNLHGEGRWSSVSRCSGLKRNGKSCRLRWVNYLRPGLRRGHITPEEENIIVELHSFWGNNMEGTLEKYERYNNAEKSLSVTNSGSSQQLLPHEIHKLTRRVELLQRNIRQYVGEDLDHLNMRELQSLELQLDTALKRIRARKNQIMNESISELQKKERAMQDQNNILGKKIKEKEKSDAQLLQKEYQLSATHNISYTSNLPHQNPLQLLHLHLPIGGPQRFIDNGGQNLRSPNSHLVPSWSFINHHQVNQ